jgi:hypothetical protein
MFPLGGLRHCLHNLFDKQPPPSDMTDEELSAFQCELSSDSP